ncbi:MAG: hypothetical protein GY755_10435 [Chloroflexi bacterium]|nr:hypothetical protein [Chloroflexota bacterium]
MCNATIQEWIDQYDEQQLRAVKAEQEADRFRAVLEELTFALETVAHLQGKERELLPMCEKVREVLKEGQAIICGSESAYRSRQR